jgi:hypothetical protein
MGIRVRPQSLFHAIGGAKCQIALAIKPTESSFDGMALALMSHKPRIIIPIIKARRQRNAQSACCPKRRQRHPIPTSRHRKNNIRLETPRLGHHLPRQEKLTLYPLQANNPLVEAGIPDPVPPGWNLEDEGLVGQIIFLEIKTIGCDSHFEVTFLNKVPVKGHCTTPRGQRRGEAEKKNFDFGMPHRLQRKRVVLINGPNLFRQFPPLAWKTGKRCKMFATFERIVLLLRIGDSGKLHRDFKKELAAGDGEASRILR